MAATKEFVAEAVALGEAGLFRKFSPGDQIVRGYADLGFEEFVLIAAGKTISMVNGKVGELPPEHLSFFYKLPPLEDLTEEILRKGYDIVSIEMPDQRFWRVKLKGPTEVTVDDRQLLVALSKSLRKILQNEK